MDSTLLKPLNLVVNRKKAKLNKRLAIFLFFLFISTILWFLIKLSHEYTTDLNHPVLLVNPPKGKVIAGTPPRTAQLKVKGLGYNLLRYKAKAQLNPIRISLKGAKPSPIAYSTEYFIVLSDILPTFASQLSGGITLLGGQPDTLYFSLDNVVDKEVPVIPAITATYANQYMLAEAVKVSPQSITITGPHSVIDTIFGVRTTPVNLPLLSQTHRGKLRITPIQQVALSQSTADFEIPVEKFTEITLEVPITALNVPDGQQVILLPRKASVKCNVPVSKFFQLKPEQFKVACDFGNADAVAGGKARVTVQKSPSHTTLVDIQPKNVDFIIKAR